MGVPSYHLEEQKRGGKERREGGRGKGINKEERHRLM